MYTTNGHSTQGHTERDRQRRTTAQDAAIVTRRDIQRITSHATAQRRRIPRQSSRFYRRSHRAIPSRNSSILPGQLTARRERRSITRARNVLQSNSLGHSDPHLHNEVIITTKHRPITRRSSIASTSTRPSHRFTRNRHLINISNTRVSAHMTTHTCTRVARITHRHNSRPPLFNIIKVPTTLLLSQHRLPRDQRHSLTTAVLSKLPPQILQPRTRLSNTSDRQRCNHIPIPNQRHPLMFRAPYTLTPTMVTQSPHQRRVRIKGIDSKARRIRRLASSRFAPTTNRGHRQRRFNRHLSTGNRVQFRQLFKSNRHIIRIRNSRAHVYTIISPANVVPDIRNHY